MKKEDDMGSGKYDSKQNKKGKSQDGQEKAKERKTLGKEDMKNR